jgi:hypothetical protein
MIRAVLLLSARVLTVALTCACSNSLPRVVPAPASPPNRPAYADASQTDVDSAMRKRGYVPALYHGERVYCRNEALTGSNLKSKVCMTAKQIVDQERAGKDLLNGNRNAGCQPTKEGACE